jgi:uncharacterized membrane protein YbhN (UPF0104 family)
VTKPVRFRGVLRLAAAALSVAMVVVLVQAMRRDGPAALDAWRAARVQWSWVAFSMVCAFAGHAIYVLGWRRLLADSGVLGSFWRLARIFLVSNLGRYLPGGKAWQMAIVGLMSAEQGLPATMVAGSSLFQGIVGVGVGAIVLFAAGGATIGLPVAWLVLPVMGIVALLSAPRIIRSAPRVQAALEHRVPGITSITAATMWALIWTSAASWIMWGVALWALANGLLAESTASVSACIAAWTGSFLAGLIAVVSPAGLGAREGVMQAVLKQAGMNATDVLVLVVVARAWITVLDVVPAAIVLVLRGRSVVGVMAPSPRPAIPTTD